MLFIDALSLSVSGFTTDRNFIYLGFLVFEISIGMYYPIMGSLKSKLVPERYRSAIYNIFRIPLNFIVIIVILSDLHIDLAFKICGIMLAVAGIL